MEQELKTPVKLRTPVTYYGGKQRMLNEILPKIPVHACYVEPFFGGGAVFFAKPPSDGRGAPLYSQPRLGHTPLFEPKNRLA